MQLVENVQRSDLKPFEEMRIVESLKNHHSLSDEEIAVKTGLSANAVSSYLTIVKGLPDQYIRMIEKGKGRSHSTKALTLGKALLLARANLPADKLKETVELIQRKGLTKQALAGKLAKQEGRKIKRVVAGRTFWKELTRTPRDYARYWSDYCELEEWEDVNAYHLSLRVTMPKDLNEPHEPDGSGTLSADEAPQVCASCNQDILEGDKFSEGEGYYFCGRCTEEKSADT